MHAFDYVIVLFSFVYAAAVTHVLATIGDLIIAGRRVRISWLNLGWMANALVSILAWWMGTWELRAVRAWDSFFLVFNFAMAGALYLVVRLVCPPIPAEGDVDLTTFHRDQGPKYLWAFTAFSAASMGYNAIYDLSSNGSYYLRQDIVMLPMTLAGATAAASVRRPLVQAACLAVLFAAWIVYFAKFQNPLAG